MSEQRLQLSAVEINGSYVSLCVCVSTICVPNSASVVNFVFVRAAVSRQQTSSGRTPSPCLCVAPKISEIEKDEALEFI